MTHADSGPDGGRIAPITSTCSPRPVSPEHADARGYETVTDPGRLAQLKIVKAARGCVPGLLIPLLDIRGATWGYQYRPDIPRIREGKPVKYETPWEQRNGLDIPPGEWIRDALIDPCVPLWITEGTKKADCGALHQLCIVSLSGVSNWRGTNALGGKTAIADFNDVALNDRPVVLAFDGDAARKPSVAKALCAFAEFLKYRGAKVGYLHLPDTDEKTGLDDYLQDHSGADLWQLVKPHQPPMNDRPDPAARTATAAQTDAQHPPDDDTPLYPSDSTATPQHPRSSVVPPVALLHRILDHVAAEVRKRGLVGEERLAKTIYLVLTSRLLDKLVSTGVKGHSASGKSYTVETVLGFFPPEAYLEFTAMSQRALVYSPEEYTHRTLVIYEVTALREGVEDDLTSYFVRSLLSEGRIKYPVTIRKPDGSFTTKEVIKEGPTNLVFTTTKTHVHAENETRILSLTTDDSRAQTARVLSELAAETGGGSDMTRWHELQRWLAGAEHRVTIPYAKALVELVPPVAVRLRRDIGSLLALIRAHAVLHQANRDIDGDGRIVATVDDYAVVRDLIADTLAEGVGQTVSATVRETVQTVAELARPAGVGLREIAHELELDKSTVSRRVRVAADGGYLRNLEDKRGKPGRWVIGDPLPESVALLPNPEALQHRNSDDTLDQQCCSVAAESQRYRDPSPNGQDPPPAGRRAACPCGRPAPVNPETGLCHYCELKAAREGTP